MNTKILMTASAVFLGVTGVVLSFLPQEIAGYLGMVKSNTIILQIAGALYFGFAMLNWMARANLMGGIYSKPVGMSNFAHFLIGGIALAKFAFQHAGLLYIWYGMGIYLIFAILFGYVSFTNPVKGK